MNSHNNACTLHVPEWNVQRHFYTLTRTMIVPNYFEIYFYINIHNRSYDQNKSRRTDALTHEHQSDIFPMVSSSSQVSSRVFPILFIEGGSQ